MTTGDAHALLPVIIPQPLQGLLVVRSIIRQLVGGDRQCVLWSLSCFDPLNMKGQAGPGHSLTHVAGHGRPRLAALLAAPDEKAEGTGCHHAWQGTLT